VTLDKKLDFSMGFSYNEDLKKLKFADKWDFLNHPFSFRLAENISVKITASL